MATKEAAVTQKKSKAVPPPPTSKRAAPEGNGKMSAKGLPDLFSGEPTITDSARFRPGNDAKLKSLLLKIYRGQASLKEVRKDALRFLRSPEGLVGFRLAAGDELEIIGKFSGEAPKPRKKAVKAKATAPAGKKAAKGKPAVEEDEEFELDEDGDEDEE